MPPSQQTWPWRKSGSTSVPRKKPPTWRLAPSPLPSPSQRRPCHPAPAAALTAPRPRRSPQKPQSSCRCQKSVPGRNPPPRPWPCPIRAAGIQSSNCPAFSPGTPVHSQNESGAVPLVNPPRPVDEWRMPAAQHIPQFPPQLAEVKETFRCPADSSPFSRLAGVTAKPDRSQAAFTGTNRQPDLHS